MLSAIAIATIVFLYLPLAAVAAMSVNSARFGTAWKGFSLRWYAQLAHNELVMHAAANTLVLAIVSTAVATILGTLLAIGLERKPLRTWFLTMWYVTSQKHGVSALGLQRVLGLGSYQTAWAWLHKLRRAMVRPGRDRLHGDPSL